MCCEDCGGITLFQGDDGATGATGPAGPTGADGKDGLYGGYSSSWKYDVGTTNSPSAQQFRFNNTNPLVASVLYVNVLNDSNIDMTNVLESFRNTNSSVDYFGMLRIFDPYNPLIFWYGRLTSLSSTAGVYTLGVDTVLSNGTFTDNYPMVITFAANGYADTFTPRKYVKQITSIFDGDVITITRAELVTAFGGINPFSTTILGAHTNLNVYADFEVQIKYLVGTTWYILPVSDSSGNAVVTVNNTTGNITITLDRGALDVAVPVRIILMG